MCGILKQGMNRRLHVFQVHCTMTIKIKKKPCMPFSSEYLHIKPKTSNFKDMKLYSKNIQFGVDFVIYMPKNTTFL